MEKSYSKAKKKKKKLFQSVSTAASEGKRGIFQMSKGGFPDLVVLHTKAADQTASKTPELSGKAPN